MEDELVKMISKPAASVIDAVLSAKIERIRAWSKEKDLNGQLDPDKLSRVFNDYLVRTANKVAYVTSIAFPQSKLSLSDVYEPLLLCVGNDYFDDASDEIILNDSSVECGLNFLIIDHAGMGKTTYSKHLVSEFLFKSERIPIFIELRVLQDTDLVDGIANELDGIGSNFSRDLLFKLINLGKFVIILDGFDEVSVDRQGKLASEIYEFSVKGGKNSVVVTSRPQEKLPQLINSTKLSFKPLTVEKAKSLALRYDKFASIDVGERLFETVDKLPENFIETPLLVSLLYRTFGFNGAIASRLSTFYAEVYDALYKGHDLTKSGFAREKLSGLDFEDFRKLVRAMSFFMMVKKLTSFKSWSDAIDCIDQLIKLVPAKPTTSANFLNDLLVSVPLMVKEGRELKFLHKTILEYFSAEYLVYSDKSSDLVNKIFNSSASESFNKTFEFLNDINSSLYDKTITKYYAQWVCDKYVDQGTTAENMFNSIMLLSDVFVGVWKFDDYKIDNDKHSQCDLPSPEFDSDSQLYINTQRYRYGDIDGVKYIFSIALSILKKNILIPTWLDISIELDDASNVEKKIEEKLDLSDAANILGKNKWVFIDSPVIKANLENDFIVEAMSFALLSKGLDISLQFSSKEIPVRVLSKDKCQRFLKNIEDEDSRIMEIESLIK